MVVLANEYSCSMFEDAVQEPAQQMEKKYLLALVLRFLSSPNEILYPPKSPAAHEDVSSYATLFFRAVSMAFARFCASDRSLDCSVYVLYCADNIAENRIMIATTTMSSIRVYAWGFFLICLTIRTDAIITVISCSATAAAAAP